MKMIMTGGGEGRAEAAGGKKIWKGLVCACACVHKALLMAKGRWLLPPGAQHTYYLHSSGAPICVFVCVLIARTSHNKPKSITH